MPELTIGCHFVSLTRCLLRGSPGVSLERRKAAALRALSELLEAGLVTLGEVGDGGFFEWDVEDEAGHGIARVAAEYGRGDLAQWSFAVWVANTAKGNFVASAGQH
jgi:hypothetical protein